MDLAAHPHSHRRNVVMGAFAVALTQQHHRLPAAASTTTTTTTSMATSTPFASTAASQFYPSGSTTTAASSSTTITSTSSSSDLWSSSWLMFDAAVESRSSHHHNHQYHGLNAFADSGSHDVDLIKSVPNVSRRHRRDSVKWEGVCVCRSFTLNCVQPLDVSPCVRWECATCAVCGFKILHLARERSRRSLKGLDIMLHLLMAKLNLHIASKHVWCSVLYECRCAYECVWGWLFTWPIFIGLLDLYVC